MAGCWGLGLAQEVLGGWGLMAGLTFWMLVVGVVG
jgi:hypothetical protein